MYNPNPANLSQYSYLYSHPYVNFCSPPQQFPTLQQHGFTDPSDVNSCASPADLFTSDQSFVDGRLHQTPGIYHNEHFRPNLLGNPACSNSIYPQNVATKLFTGIPQIGAFPPLYDPSTSSMHCPIQGDSRRNHGDVILTPAPSHGYPCNLLNFKTISPSPLTQGGWNFAASTTSCGKMRISENGDNTYSTAAVAENCQQQRYATNEGHRKTFNETQGQHKKRVDQSERRYNNYQQASCGNTVPPLPAFKIDPKSQRPYLLNTPPLTYEDISDDSEDDHKRKQRENLENFRKIANDIHNKFASQTSKKHHSKQVLYESYTKETLYIPMTSADILKRERTNSSDELKMFLDQLDSAQCNSEAKARDDVFNKLPKFDFTSDESKSLSPCGEGICVKTEEVEVITCQQTEMTSPKEEVMPYEEEVTSYEEEFNPTLPDSLQTSALPHKIGRSSIRKQSKPRRSAPLKDPTFKGVVFTVQTRLLNKTPGLIMAPCRSWCYGRVGRRIRVLARLRSCSSSDTSSESENEITNPSSPLTLGKQCASCSTRKTPLWRDAEDGTPLCNACGIRYKKYRIRCTRCWNIPKKDSKTYPKCSSCGAALRYALIKKISGN